MTFFPFARASATALALMLAVPAMAQQATLPTPAAEVEASPETLALARAVIDFTGGVGAFDSVVPQIFTDARATILRTRPTLQADLDAVIEDTLEEYAGRTDELLNRIAGVYAVTFTEEELREIVDFYQSPVGQKLNRSLPGVLERSYTEAQSWGQQLSAEIMNDLREKMAARGHTL